jgi:hypothetical protein
MVLVRVPDFFQEHSMIKCKGTLRIKKIRQSRNGAFCIADLSTDFGEFKVKDPMLDQFEEGEYQGTLWINEIYMAQYISYGKAVTELRARLHDLQVDSEDRKSVRTHEHSEPDPLDEVPTPQVPKKPASEPVSAKGSRWASVKSNKLGAAASPAEPVTGTGKAPEKGAATASGNEDNVKLFGADLAALIEQHQTIKLDPTVDRMLLRTQAATLRSKGYIFDSKQQAWIYQAG